MSRSGTAVAERKARAARGEIKLCGRPKSNGEPCTQEAGFGTDHEGKGACRWHENRGGGLLSTARKLNDEIVASSPGEAIAGVLNLAVSRLMYVNAQVQALKEEEIWTGESEERLNKWLRWEDRLSDKVAKYAGTAVSMGVAEREVAVKEAQTLLVGKFIEAVLEEVGLTAKQRKKVGPAIRQKAPLLLGSGE